MRHSKKIAVLLLAAFCFALIGGCGQSGQEDSSLPVASSRTEEQALTGDYVEKEVLTEQTPMDNKAIYEDDDETSVIVMYLTVSAGNTDDGTDHTWTEVNAYSAYYYEEEGIDRYAVEGILQVGDENGPLEDEFGYEETVPNVTVQIRGQSSSRSSQKSYKISIMDGKGEWRNQQTIALNKHVYTPLRFTNKLAYDLMKEIPQMFSARTQFVHLYVRDLTEGGSGEYEDYGLFTQVEQLNKTYLENHGLDRNGQFYKLNHFEWQEYDAVMKLSTDLDYDETAFEEYLEIKGSDDHSKLIALIEKINDYTVSIEDIVEQYFDLENLCYWMAFQTLIGNSDTGSRNVFIYSPLNSEKWYFISWDNDAGFMNTYYEVSGIAGGESWETGLSKYLGCILFNRIFKEEEYRQALDDAVEDLKNNYLTEEKVDAMARAYAAIVKEYQFSEPDSKKIVVTSDVYDLLVDSLAGEIKENYQDFKESLLKPWPFYVGVPEKEDDGTWTLTWDTSYDVNGEEITYYVAVATDYLFENLVYEEDSAKIPEVTLEGLTEGVYYIRLYARNESGYEQDCFDYCSFDTGGKLYGVKAFYVDATGECVDYSEAIVTS
ncbi:MAG: CotH kinase family protein [Lachnospiraceae bacterium]|nr:CotH kinase family protein [Lachnospiraceae bacterium]